jgi:hypothetical protein
MLAYSILDIIKNRVLVRSWPISAVHADLG